MPAEIIPLPAPKVHNFTTHGMWGTTLYLKWKRMIDRCQRTTCRQWPYYGGRGIKVCDRWLDPRNFVADMGLPPSPKHTLERVDNDGDYEPGNVVWATMKDQNRNKRDSHMLEFQGRRLCISAWAEVFGIDGSMIWKRIRRGWSVEDALTVANCHVTRRPMFGRTGHIIKSRLVQALNKLKK